MIKNIKIENYRDLNLKLKDCTQINIIIGKSGSGKTTLLEQPYQTGNLIGNIIFRYFYGFKQYVTIETDQIICSDDLIDYSKMIDSIVGEPVEMIIADACYENKEIKYFLEKIQQDLFPIRNNYVRQDGIGVKKFYKIITELFVVGQNGFVSIDDIEIGWHISVFEPYLKWILQTAKEKNVQLFISTHSLEIIDTVLNLVDNPDDITLFNLDRKQRQQRFSGELLKRIRFDRSLDVR
jgi:AAA15 family ATPase/GTPase